ncbi:helix-turn-helix transcriptional regulator [Winogradskyella eckloniae]|uniref:Helix-turn-helix transcriptional regulator n=1 Tax=Psychroserpens ponticola TaxID=2932268 RepID=A0ABY7RXX4_9FLAO|nr:MULTISPECIES: helix-turn-helix transcriptional regulator [Flavobacteriaceae]NRD18608.1 helix-turn-helix transcriptional regulator [Winogradskyella eckloniae]WCO01723.1 helix-turn-helix transcriptional regulator [Psychroserpens ponticola]
MILSELLKSKRETKNLLLREVASMIDTDTALISKIEKGDRKPTREQIDKLAIALDIEHSKLLKLWLSEKVYEDVKGEDVAIDAIKIALKRIKTEEKN